MASTALKQTGTYRPIGCLPIGQDGFYSGTEDDDVQSRCKQVLKIMKGPQISCSTVPNVTDYNYVALLHSPLIFLHAPRLARIC